MSREISISFRDGNGSMTPIEVRAPYFLFGTQQTSIKFWSIPKLKEIGITRLSELGDRDPIYFVGWECMADLDREIKLLYQHLNEIEFNSDIKASWLAHLVYCYQLLILTAPKDSVPDLTIG